jgi:CheY-like chemotaxis protein
MRHERPGVAIPPGTRKRPGSAMAENIHLMSEVGLDEGPAASGLTAPPSSHVAQSGSWTNRQWRVLLVDDDAVVRPLLRALLEEHEGLQVVGEASDGEEAVVLAEQYRPDVILMDIHLPRVSGVEATRQINKKLPQSMIIGVSCLYTPHDYNAMLAAGAVAFVRKEDAVGGLYKTIEFAMHTCCPNRRPSVVSTAATRECGVPLQSSDLDRLLGAV